MCYVKLAYTDGTEIEAPTTFCDPPDASDSCEVQTVTGTPTSFTGYKLPDGSNTAATGFILATTDATYNFGHTGTLQSEANYEYTTNGNIMGMKYDNFEYSNFFTFRYDAEQPSSDSNPSYEFTRFTIVLCGFILFLMIIVTASNPQGWSPANMPSIADGIA
jgi:hypothetical protein